jgi:tRNA threonylcarbamoyl adenosine modification protein YeaZ
MEIAIDTSSNLATIALSHKGEIVAELTWQSTQNHTAELMPNLAYLLDKAKIQPKSIEAVIVAKGPGSFNGLRVGMSTAKGIAFSLNAPLLGISTLELEAYPFGYTALRLRPIHEIGHGQVATALYRQENYKWRRLEEERLTTLEVLCQECMEPTLFCGEISTAAADQIRRKLGGQAIIPEASARLRRAGFLAILGWQRLSKGERDDLSILQPLYLRPPHITKPKETSLGEAKRRL